jgi:hypothetical protein
LKDESNSSSDDGELVEKEDHSSEAKDNTDDAEVEKEDHSSEAKDNTDDAEAKDNTDDAEAKDNTDDAEAKDNTNSNDAEAGGRLPSVPRPPITDREHINIAMKTRLAEIRSDYWNHHMSQ